MRTPRPHQPRVIRRGKAFGGRPASRNGVDSRQTSRGVDNKGRSAAVRTRPCRHGVAAMAKSWGIRARRVAGALALAGFATAPAQAQFMTGAYPVLIVPPPAQSSGDSQAAKAQANSAARTLRAAARHEGRSEQVLPGPRENLLERRRLRTSPTTGEHRFPATRRCAAADAAEDRVQRSHPARGGSPGRAHRQDADSVRTRFVRQ